MGLIESKEYVDDNERIAAILGYKKWVGRKTNGREDGLAQWEYPSDMRDFVRGIPCTELPDFVGILHRHFSDQRKYGYGMYHRPKRPVLINKGETVNE